MRQTIILMAACAALLAGCTNEVGEGLGIDTPIQVTANVEGIMTTRAENTEGNLDNFGLSIKDKDGNYTEPYGGENISVTKPVGESVWTLADEVLFQGSGQTYYAYAPYQSIGAGVTSVNFSIKTDQSGSEYMQASDLLYAAGNVDDPTLAITFSHKLSKLTVTLTAEDFAEDEVSFTGVTLRGTLPTTTLNLTDGAVNTASGTATDIKMWKSSTNTYECILVPQEATYSVRINATVGGEQKTYVYTPSAGQEFLGNKSYTLALKVKKADEPTAIESINVKGWGENTDLTAGEATEKNYTIEADGSYTVYTAEGLQAWATAVGSDNKTNCTLAADIDMSDRGGWRRIVIYSGTFDGNGHTITGLGDCLIEGNQGTVRNLILAEPNIFAEPTAGAVACENGNVIENCHVVGGEISGGIHCGGIAGKNSPGGSILACSSSAEVTGSGMSTGGIVGDNVGTILACYATGSVTGSDFNGAIVGHNFGITTACYWSGESAQGVGDGSEEAVEVADGDWITAMPDMNAALSGTGYQWELNPDDKTGNRPLVIATM